MKKTVISIAKGIFKVGKRVSEKVAVGDAAKNISEENGEPVGKLDKVELIATIISTSLPVIMLIGLMADWITVDEIKEFVRATRDLPSQVVEALGALFAS